MSAVKKFRVKSKLSQAIGGKDGITVALALKRADEGLETIRAPGVEDIDVNLAAIDARFGPGAAGRDAESLEDLYLLASRIIDVAICLQGSGIDLAARALCDLVDLSETLGVRDWEAVEVHIDALKLLRTAGLAMTPAQLNHVLDGLARVTRKRVGDSKAIPSSEA